MDEEKKNDIPTEQTTDEATTETIVVTPPAPEEVKKKRFAWTKKKAFLAVLAVLVLGGGGAAAFVLTRKDTPKTTNNAQTSTNTSTNTATTTDTAANLKDLETISVEGNTYFTTPKKLEDLKFFVSFAQYGQSCDQGGKNCQDDLKASDISYYQVGTTKDGKAIIQTSVESLHGEMGGSASYVALETAPKTYAVLAQNSGLLNPDAQGKVNETYASDIAKGFNKNVTMDFTSKLNELAFPKEMTVAGQKVKSGYDNPTPYFTPKGLVDIRGPYFGTVTEPAKTKKVGTSGNITLYEVTYKTTDHYKIMELYGVFANLYALPYQPNGELASSTDKLPITWTTGDTSAVSAYSGGAGCGSTGYVTTVSTPSGLVQVGTTKAGQKIYQLPTSDPLVQELYNDDYAAGNTADSYLDASLKNLTIQQFTDKHAYFVVQNGLNEYVVFQRSDMFMRGGCGKPVVYLYPTAPTVVSVKVGADVVISVPTYESNGWQNVFAKPDGSLTYRGAAYDSLYWEGYGHGTYPEITEGSVVKSSDAVATIKSQLQAQGFNQKETADFMAYWQPKLPHSAYVRLTWFGTAAMDQLAPLSINPRPTTVIRTFLDFEGLDAPINLPSQTFRTPKRIGFTVTEWGGLLREGIR